MITQKGRGYPPAEDDDEKHLHDAPVFDPLTGPPKAVPTGYTQAFADAVVKEAEADDRIVAITAAMAGPTGLLPFQDPVPRPLLRRRHRRAARRHRRPPGWRWAGCGRSSRSTRRSSTGPGTRSCTTSRCTGCRSCSASTAPASPAPTARATTACTTWRCSSRVPGMRVLAPSSAQELHQMLHDAMSLADGGPVAIRYARGPGPQRRRARGRHRHPGPRARARRRATSPTRCASSPSASWSRRAEKAADILTAEGIGGRRSGTSAAARRSTPTCSPTRPRHRAVVTCEDGIRDGGIGMTIEDRLGAIAPAVPVDVLGTADAVPPPRRPSGADPVAARPGRRRNLRGRPPVPLVHARARPFGPRPVTRQRRSHVRATRSPTPRRSPSAPRRSATSASGSPSTTTCRRSPARRRRC